MKSILAWARTFPPHESAGWTIHFIERESRYWLTACVGRKNSQLFEQATYQAWQWASRCRFVRWFTDGEPRYAQQLWKLASVYLKTYQFPKAFGHRKVWRGGLEVAMKVKGSQGKRRVAWCKKEHPYTAISPQCEVHANHNEAQNSALRRHCGAYRRRQNHYAKTKDALQRVVTVQRLVHNWIRPHWSLRGTTTPAMAIDFYHRPVTMLELLSWRASPAITP